MGLTGMEEWVLTEDLSREAGPQVKHKSSKTDSHNRQSTRYLKNLLNHDKEKQY
jgi:hypothetical protein